jgi:hypothetical protein
VDDQSMEDQFAAKRGFQLVSVTSSPFGKKFGVYFEDI